MDPNIRPLWTAAAALACLLGGCDKLKLNQPPAQSTQRPTPQQMQRLSYMSQASVGPDGHKVFDHLEQAKSCHDLELAMRWNRPPDVQGGPFNQKMVYLIPGVPPNLAKQAEVFISGRIKRGESLASGSSGWSLRIADGSEVQAIEPAEYWQKQEQDQQEGRGAAIVKPYLSGRMLCGRGIYQGAIGKSLDGGGPVPLVEMLFAIDRAR